MAAEAEATDRQKALSGLLLRARNRALEDPGDLLGGDLAAVWPVGRGEAENIVESPSSLTFQRSARPATMLPLASNWTRPWATL